MCLKWVVNPLSVLIIAGCASQPVITVPVPEYVPVPPTLLEFYECGGRDIVTNGDLLLAYSECRLANQKHNADKEAIRNLRI